MFAETLRPSNLPSASEVGDLLALPLPVHIAVTPRGKAAVARDDARELEILLNRCIGQGACSDKADMLALQFSTGMKTLAEVSQQCHEYLHEREREKERRREGEKERRRGKNRRREEEKRS